MLRRPILQLAERHSARSLPLQITTQVPSYLSSRRALSGVSLDQKKQPGPADNNPRSGSPLPIILGGGLAIGSVFLAAYHYGALDKYLGKELHNISEHNKDLPFVEATKEASKRSENSQESEFSSPVSKTSSEDQAKDSDIRPTLNQPGDSKLKGEDTAELSQDNLNHVQEKDLPSAAESSLPSDEVISKQPDNGLDAKNQEVNTGAEHQKEVDGMPIIMQSDKVPEEKETGSMPGEHITAKNMEEADLGDESTKSTSLLDDYYLTADRDNLSTTSINKSKEAIAEIEDVHGGSISKDGMLVLDFLQAIHAAERRQAELDARRFAEEKRVLKEKYEKELKDARARELMYAEREVILDKELNKERAKAAAAIKSLQEQFEEKLKSELAQKETEAELKLKKQEELAKAELAAAIASEKASQIEKLAEENLHINALCMAFYARSEEARQSHSVNKLSLGAVALEDALSKGLPIRREMEALHTYLEGIDKDSLLDLVLSSLPEETHKYGTDTISQLNHKFESLKGTLRHFSLLPPGGGGILAHSLAHVASWLKVKEVDQTGDGIESVINRVESLLAQGKLCEAADALENGVKGTQAVEIVGDWVKRARNRAITEQALTFLQSYATAVSLT